MSPVSGDMAPNPMELAHLRPTATLEMMDNVFAVFATRKKLFFGLGLLSQLPIVSVLIAFPLLAGGAEVDWAATSFRSWVLVAMVVQMWPIAALIAAAFQTMLFPGRPLQFASLLRASFAQLPHLIVTRIFARLLLVLLAGVGMMSLVQSQSGGAGQVIMLGLGIWSMLAIVYFSIVWALIGPVVMIERRSMFRALARSMELMRLKFGAGIFGDTPIRRLLIVGLFPFTVFCLGRLIIAGVSLLVTGDFSLFSTSGLAVIATEATVDLLLGSVYLPWFTIALVAIYVECRMRREALDMQVRLLAKGEIADEGILESQ